MKKIKLDKNNILVLIIGLLSVGNIIFQLYHNNYLSIINSAIGIIGVILFFLKKGSFRYFVWIWIFAQAIIINRAVIDPSRNLLVIEPIFDLAQLFSVKFGFNSSGANGAFSLNFNLLVILYFFLFRKLKTTALIGKAVGLLILKGNNDLSFEDGLYANLKQRVNLDNDDSWLLGQLSSEILYNNKSIDRVLIQTIDGELSEVFRLVYGGQVIKEGLNQATDFEKVDWLMFE
jgi:hypothetical protein